MVVKSNISGTNQTLDLGGEQSSQTYRDRLIAENLSLVRRLCLRFSRSGEPMEDLVQVGSIGLLKAVEKYDPDRGPTFKAYAVPVIVGEIKNYFRDHGWAVKIPRKVQSQKMAVDRMVEVLNQKLGHSPTVLEISEATGFTKEEVYDTFEIERYGRPLSLDAEHHWNGNDDASKLLDFLGNDDPNFEEMINRVDLAHTLQCLTDQERAVILFKYYSELSQCVIGERLGVSQMQVSRLQRSALGKLKLTYPR